MNTPMQPFSDLSFGLVFALLLLAPLAIAGVALINTGLGRARSAAQALLGCLAVVSISLIAFVAVGSAFAGGSGAISVTVAGRPFNLMGIGPLFLSNLGALQPQVQLSVLLECLAVGFAAMIPWGAGADRWRLTAGCASAAVLGVLVFPFLVHWTWGGGWLAQLGVNWQLGYGFVDAGGAASVHALGGLAALAVIWIAGPRKGKFPKEGLATAMPGHNAVFVLFGSLIALVGWLAWNAAGAILWLKAGPSALPTVAIDTLLAAASALAATYCVTSIRFGKPDASLCANGWLAGLVTSSACAGIVSPGAAIFAGAVAGTFTPLLVEVLELALSIDDPSGAIGVHAIGSLWGLFVAGMFAPQKGQFLAHLLGIAVLLGLVFPVLYLLFALLNRAVPFRVDADGERLGMDLHELGGGAYPEFVLHRDDSYR